MTADHLRPAYLRCEQLENPLGLGVAQPQLSWAGESARRGQIQSAYQILVASSADLLAAGQGDLWDSGAIRSDQSVGLAYAGLPLVSRQRAWWAVRLWDMDGRASEYSQPAWWELGLRDRADWRGQWVGGASAGDAKTGSAAPFLRTSFALDRPVARARLYITALGLYEARINGQVVGDAVLAPGWTDYSARVQYQAYDVAGLLRQGENAIGAVLGDGWYCGRVGWLSRQVYGDRPRLLAQLEIAFDDGTTQTISSGPEWRVADGPILSADLQAGECYDARRELGGWDSPGYDDMSWQPATIFADPGIALDAMRGPPVRRMLEIAPVADPQAAQGRGGAPAWIFDFGQNMVGHVRLRARGPAGTTVTLRFAEVLDADDNLYTASLRSARQTDEYTLRGGGEEVWEPRFTFHGFRYVELSGLPDPPPRDTLTGVVVYSDTAPTGSFTCSDPLIAQLQRNIVWGQRGNFVDVPTDCPQRDERLGWTGDAQVFVRTAAFNIDVASFFRKWLRDLDDAQLDSGAYPKFAPSPGDLPDGGPAWADAGVIVPWTIYRCYGDVGVLAEHYGAMRRFVEFMRETSRDGLRCYPEYAGYKGHGDWLAVDGATDREGLTSKELIGTAFYAHSSRLLGQIAQVLGHSDDAARYRGLFDQARLAFQRRFVAPDGSIADGTQTAYVLALHFDLLPDELRPAALAALVRDIAARGSHLSTGFVGTPYLAWVLSAGGRSDVAYELLRQTSWPSWLYPVTQGATTIWERWDGWTHDRGFQDPGMNSFNHYAYGAIGDWMYAAIGGIDLDPELPAYKRTVMRPLIGGELTSAEAELRSIYGLIRSAWRLEGGALEWQIVVPPNTTATVYVPAADGSEVREGDMPADEAPGVRLLRREGGAAVYAVGAGSYRFSAAAGL